jgi:predicted esterase
MPVEPHRLQTPRTARYFTEQGDGPIRRIWILLHGHAMLAERFLSYLTAMSAPGTLLVAPEALSRFYLGTRLDGGHDKQVGATWMTREERDSEIDDMVGYLDRVMQAATPVDYREVPVGILGFSQGVATAARWIARGTMQPRMLVCWGAPAPADAPLEAVAALCGAVRLVAGIDDPIVPSGTFEHTAEKLRAFGVDADVIRFPGGHILHAATARALAEHFALLTR